MGNTAQNEIKRALNAIRTELDNASTIARLEALQLMMQASAEIVARARKLTGQNEIAQKGQPAKTKLATVAQIPKPKPLPIPKHQPSTSKPKPPGTITNTKSKPKTQRNLAPIKPKPTV
jgi:hypothetical protein